MAHSLEITGPLPEKFEAKRAGVLPSILLMAGGAGILLSLIGLAVPAWRAQFGHSWLFAFEYFFLLSVGCLFWICLHHATDSEWGVVVRRQMENVAGLLPWFALLFLPLLIPDVSKTLWHWWDLKPGDDPLLDNKRDYLTHQWFYIRCVLYFLLLGGLAFLLRARSTKQDQDGAPKHSFVMRKLGVIGIMILAVSLTFSSIDWLMCLDYHWFSTMWGVYIFAGAAGASMSLLVIIVTQLRARNYLAPVSMEHYHIMGKFMLAFCIFWAYIGFDQYMLIWYANIPEETIYFKIRNTETWNYLSTLLVVGRFFIPFPVLLFQFTKKNPNLLIKVAYWILFMQAVDVYVVVLPALHPTGFAPSIFDLTAFIGIGGIVGWLWFRTLKGAHTLPIRDPRLAASIQLTN